MYSLHMSKYIYKHEDMHRLLEEAGTYGNLAANLKLSIPAVKRLCTDKYVTPQDATVKKVAPFVTGKKEIEQKTRKYRRRA